MEMTINELYDKIIRIFSPNFIRLAVSSQIEIEENQNQKNDKFKKLFVNCPSNCIIIDDELLKSSNNSFYGVQAPKLNVECDRILITEIEGKKYVLLFEIKSSFWTALSDGIPQLRASCFKIQSFLNCIEGFALNEYVFFTILASWKPTSEQVIKIIKKENIKEPITEREMLAKRVYDKDVVRSKIDRNRLDLFYSLPVKPEYLQDIPLCFFTTQHSSTIANLNLENVLNNI